VDHEKKRLRASQTSEERIAGNEVADRLRLNWVLLGSLSIVRIGSRRLATISLNRLSNQYE